MRLGFIMQFKTFTNFWQKYRVIQTYIRFEKSINNESLSCFQKEDVFVSVKQKVVHYTLEVHQELLIIHFEDKLLKHYLRNSLYSLLYRKEKLHKEKCNRSLVPFSYKRISD